MQSSTAHNDSMSGNKIAWETGDGDTCKCAKLAMFAKLPMLVVSSAAVQSHPGWCWCKLSRYPTIHLPTARYLIDF